MCVVNSMARMDGMDTVDAVDEENRNDTPN